MKESVLLQHFGVTGNSLPSDVEHFLNHGADTVLLKPLNVDELNRAMKSKLEMR